MIIEGTFQVDSWNEVTQKEFEAESKINRAVVEQNYSGQIEGKSTVEYTMYYPDANNSSFVGIECFEGEIEGKFGRLTFQHTGKFEFGVASSDFEVIHGTGQLLGYAGKGSFQTGSHGSAECRIEFDLG